VTTRTSRGAAEIDKGLLWRSLVERKIYPQWAVRFLGGLLQPKSLVERDDRAPLIDRRPLDADGASNGRLVVGEMGKHVRFSHARTVCHDLR